MSEPTSDDDRQGWMGHYRLPIPHKRMQVATHPDWILPRVYIYDHVIHDSLDGIETKDMDCRLGLVPNQERVDRFMNQIMGNQDITQEPDEHGIDR